ncbi:MAG: WD40 repeat domain-containing protein [Bacillota bacterium]
MRKKKMIYSLGILIFIFMVLLSGCRLGPKTETIIIPNSEADYNEDQSSQPFQVNKIYRLPDDFTNSGQILGWTSYNSILASYRKNSMEQVMLKRLTYPYEQSEILQEIKTDTSEIELSPNGKYICEIQSGTKGIIKLISIDTGNETEVEEINSLGPMYVQDIAWSSNGKYLSYLVMDPRENGDKNLRLYDIDSQSYKKYKLKGNLSKNILDLNISDDGRSVLLTAIQNNTTERYILLGTTTEEGEFQIQYEHQIGLEQSSWINNNQFAFIGTDLTLYEYDLRNGELAVLLDNVSSFVLSHDKRSIAYTLYGQDIIYAGRIQGKNILFKEPVYHGILPVSMYWNLDNKSLVIYGQKQFSPTPVTKTDDFTVGQAFIIEFH